MSLNLISWIVKLRSDALSLCCHCTVFCSRVLSSTAYDVMGRR